ncbi:hypothetical protein LCGC14_1499950 [marine sediment metagenome]|uniref:Uncharacterized protein n=1 Tax=marine sediment metagenome TaxID=412755 RepID=A0A0F9LK18_9ZZZZ
MSDKKRRTLNGDELLETFRKLRSQPGAISDVAADEMILAGIVDTRNAVARVADQVGCVDKKLTVLKENEIAHLALDIKEIKKEWKENPSLLYLLRYKTTKTVRILLIISVVVVFALMTIWFNLDLRVLIQDWLKNPYVDPGAIIP